MSGIIKRVYIINVAQRFKTVLYGLYTSRVQAEELAARYKSDNDVLSVRIDEIPINEDNPVDLVAFIKNEYPLAFQ